MKRPLSSQTAALVVMVTLLALLLAPALASAAPAVHVVTGIGMTPQSPNLMRLDQRVNVTFSYVSPEPTGVRIFVRPMTGGDRTPHYAAHGSPLYPTGSGTGSGWFTISQGNATVDHIQIRMLNADQSVVLDEVMIPVCYRFRSAGNVVSKLTMTATPNVLRQKQRVSVSFKYRTTQKAGVRVLIRPMTGGSLTKDYSANASSLYKGSGAGSGWFTVTKGTSTVDKVRVQMWNAS